ncbi:MAG: AAA family ATPase [Solirubrobacterales bacterium]
MILQSLRLKDFRQYEGEQTLRFSTSKDRNVTVVYGANGAGKTALLNAFTWVLYGCHTPAFEQADDLINHTAWSEATPGEVVEASVTLAFEDKGQAYTVERVSSARKGEDGSRIPLEDGEVRLRFIDESGRSHVRDNPEKSIRQILPDRLHSFFFFDGEQIEKLASKNAYADIEDAIKTILGLTVIERAIHHLDKAGEDLAKEAAEVGSDDDKRLNEEQERIRAEIEEIGKERSRLNSENKVREAEITKIYAQLASMKEAHELQVRREEREAELQEVEAEIGTSKRSLAEAISKRGHLAFLEGLAAKVEGIVEGHRVRGEIPSAIKLQLIQDLLSDGKCICGRELVEGQSPYDCVEAWKEQAGDGLSEEAWIRVGAEANRVFGDRDRLYEYLHETNRELGLHRVRRQTLREQLDEIRETMGKIDSEEIRKLEQRREQLLEDSRHATMRLGVLQERQRGLEAELGETEKALLKAEAKNQEAKVAKRRVAVAREVKMALQSVLDAETNAVRNSLDTQIAQLYAETSYKDYRAQLNENFELRLTKPRDEESDVARSSGESQILSLAFVGAVADFARRRSEERDGKDEILGGFAGGIFPVVMDSPFGKLDVAYQERVAEAIPKLAPQVIVLVSKSQGLGAVKDVLWPRVGKQAVIRHATGDRTKAEDIELPSGKVPFVVYEEGVDSAEIVEV